MSPETRRRVLRASLWTAVAHTGFVLVAVVAKNALWGTAVSWWKIDRLLRFVDLPVLWIVDRTIQNFPLIPPQAAFGRLWVASSVSEFIAYGIFGGAFYVLLVAAVVLLVARRREAAIQTPS